MTDKLLIYLGCPYSHPDRAVRVERFEKVTKVAAKLIEVGYHVYSPITHSHPMAEVGKLPGDWDFWEKQDRLFLSISKAMFVLHLPGWSESKGLQAEIKIADEMGIPIVHISEGAEHGRESEQLDLLAASKK